MLDPTSLFAWDSRVDQRTVHADTLVVTLGSYLDAGHGQRLVDAHLLEHLPHRELGEFDADQLLDYAGRRPTITFDRDHFSEYQRPRIVLRQLTDAEGRDFLLLSGPEPALQWERLAAGIGHIAEQLGVRSTVVVQAMPAPAPHTRPVVVSRFASDPAQVADAVPVLGTFQLSASFTGVLTVRLGEAGHPVLGLVAHVPHYVAEADHPAAALSLLGALRESTRLALPAGDLDLRAGITAARIDTQVAASEELTAMVEALERAHDQFLQEHSLRATSAQEIPSAEEVGQHFEQFLAGLDGEQGPGEAPDAG